MSQRLWAICCPVGSEWYAIPGTISRTRQQAIAALGEGNVDRDPDLYQQERRAGRIKAMRVNLTVEAPR